MNSLGVLFRYCFFQMDILHNKNSQLHKKQKWKVYFSEYKIQKNDIVRSSYFLFIGLLFAFAFNRKEKFSNIDDVKLEE